MIAPVGDEQSVAVLPIGAYRRAARNIDLVSHSVHPYADGCRSFGQQIRRLGHAVAAAINMQPHPPGGAAICTTDIVGMVGSPRRVGRGVVNLLFIAVDGASEEIPPVDGVAEILEDGQFKLHECIVITPPLMAHQGVSQLAVRYPS